MGLPKRPKLGNFKTLKLILVAEDSRSMWCDEEPDNCMILSAEHNRE